MSFVEREDVMDVIERLLVETVSVLYPKRFQNAIPRASPHREAMEICNGQAGYRDDQRAKPLGILLGCGFPFSKSRGG